MGHRQGGITIFLAIVYLSLIVFSCSIVEMTRINIVKIQAERAMISASQSVLGGYDNYLKDNYGIFARATEYGDVAYMPDAKLDSYDAVTLSNKDMLTQDYMHYVNTHVGNNTKDLPRSIIDTQFFDGDEPDYWHLTRVKLDDMFVYYPNRLIDTDSNNIEYIKDDMLKFMDLRVPMLLLGPLLEKINAFEKAGKTGEFIKEKNSLIEEAQETEGDYLELFKLIEGVEVDTSTGGLRLSSENYVKKLAVPRDDEAISHYDVDYISDTLKADDGYSIQQTLTGQVLNLKDYTNDYQIAITKAEQLLPVIKSTLIAYKELEDKIVVQEAILARRQESLDALDNQAEAIRSDLETLNTEDENYEGDNDALLRRLNDIRIGQREISYDIAYVQDEIIHLRDQQVIVIAEMKRLIPVMEGYYQRNIINVQMIDGLITGEGSYLKVNQKAKTVVESVQSSVIQLGDDIDTFIGGHEPNRSDYIESSYEHSTKELVDLKNSYGLEDAETSFDSSGNLSMMLEALNDNVTLLEGCRGQIETIVSENSIIVRQLYSGADLTSTELSEIATLTGDTESICLKIEPIASNFDVEAHVSKVLELSRDMEAYSREQIFDYSQYDTYLESCGEDKDLLQGFRDIFEAVDFDKITDQYTLKDVELLENMPSEMMAVSKGMEAVEIDLDYSDGVGDGEAVGDSQFFDAASGLSSVKTGMINVRETLFLNEYAMGMFTSYPDKFDPMATTLSGQLKSGHMLDTEVEYILTGNTEPDKALQSIVMKIFAIRVVCNIIHLMTNSAKRTTIINMANAIAGWWSFGLAAIIAGVLITLLWASVESIIDIMFLVGNKRVPLIKTMMTWYSDPSGNIDDLASFAVEKSIGSASIVFGGVKDEVTETITGLGEEVMDITEDTLEFYQSEVEMIYVEGKSTIEAKAMRVSNAYYAAVDDYLLLRKKGEAYLFNQEDYFDNDMQRSLLSEMIDYIEVEMTGVIREDDVGIKDSVLAKARRLVLNAFDEKIKASMDEAMTSMTTEFDKDIKMFTEGLNKEISELSLEGELAANDIIKKKADEFVNNMKRETGNSGMAIDGEQDGFAITDVIPSLSYNDYLRMFMLMDYDGLDSRVYRMLDMIELNLAYTHPSRDANNQPSRRLENYAIGVTAYGNFEMSFGLFLTPFLMYRDRNVDETLVFTVTTVNNYE